jgi:hypothetical protein
MKLRGVEYVWKESDFTPMKDWNVSDIGFIAQEVLEVEPNLTFKLGDGKLQGVKYGQMVTLIIDAIQYQHSILLQREQELQKLESIAKEKGLI